MSAASLHLALLQADACPLALKALLPNYLAGKDTKRPAMGVVHLGPGAFFRGHQAYYFDQVLRLSAQAGAVLPYSICAVSMRSADVATALNPQDGLYVLAQMEQQTSLSIMGAIRQVLVAQHQYEQVLAQLVSADTTLVTMTITEKGYCLASNGELDLLHVDIQHDLALPTSQSAHRSAVGLLTAALYGRYLQQQAPLVLFSCDNLTDNGHKLAEAIRKFAKLSPLFAGDSGFSSYLSKLICPCSMVDSITPATDDALRTQVQTELAVTDAWPVKREAFCQWVIEDVLPAHLQTLRQYLQQAGVIFTSDVRAFEAAKLRLLNAPHSTLAYVGSLLGLDTVYAAMQCAPLAALAKQLVADEILPSVPAVAGFDLTTYSQAIFQRFENPAVRHLLAQITWDGSQKLQMRLLPVVRANLAAGRSIDLLAVAIASWLLFIRLRALQQQPLVDPIAEPLLALAKRCTGDVATDVALWLTLGEVFGPDLPKDTRFRTALEHAYLQLSPLLACHAQSPQDAMMLQRATLKLFSTFIRQFQCSGATA